jgi:hypothetical protein
MEHRISTAMLSLILFSALFFACSSVMAAKVYRWVDENGEIHYSESLPPDFQDKSHDELDERGILRAEDQSLVPPPPPPKVESADEPQELPRDSSGMKRAKALLSDVEMQQQMDRFLMLRYESEQEIEDAMDVEIKQLEYDRLLLRNTRKSMHDSYLDHVSHAGNMQRSGTQVDEQKKKSINELRTRLESNAVLLAGLEAREIKIREAFAVEQARYHYLIENWVEDS